MRNQAHLLAGLLVMVVLFSPAASGQFIPLPFWGPPAPNAVRIYQNQVDGVPEFLDEKTEKPGNAQEIRIYGAQKPPDKTPEFLRPLLRFIEAAHKKIERMITDTIYALGLDKEAQVEEKRGLGRMAWWMQEDVKIQAYQDILKQQAEEKAKGYRKPSPELYKKIVAYRKLSKSIHHERKARYFSLFPSAKPCDNVCGCTYYI